jgi:hypothetical protein
MISHIILLLFYLLSLVASQYIEHFERAPTYECWVKAGNPQENRYSVSCQANESCDENRGCVWRGSARESNCRGASKFLSILAPTNSRLGCNRKPIEVPWGLEHGGYGPGVVAIHPGGGIHGGGGGGIRGGGGMRGGGGHRGGGRGGH